MKVIEDIRYGNEENDFLDIFRPDGDISEILIWFHGGGFEGGNRKNLNILRERGVDTRLERIDEAAPIYYVSEDSDFKNLLIIYYTDDMPCRPEQNRLFYKSVKRICSEQNVEIVELPGGHCNGSSNRNEEGLFDFNETVLSFIKREHKER